MPSPSSSPAKIPPPSKNSPPSTSRNSPPAGILERFEVNTIVRCDWQRRRLARIEANLYRELLAEGADPEEIDVTILRDSPTGKLLLKVQSQIAALERTYHRALNEFRRLRRGAAPQPEAPTGEPLPESIPTVLPLPARNEPNHAVQPISRKPGDNPALRL